MEDLLQKLCEVHSPSGEEWRMKDFILEYVEKVQRSWKNKPIILEGSHFQDCVMLVFGQPTIAAFAHMDTTGFTVRYQDQLIPIGGPEISGGEILVGGDVLGEIECKLHLDDHDRAKYVFGRGIETGTSLVFKPKYQENIEFVESPYLDNRIGIYNLLKLAETLENGVLVFSCWEEHGGGSVPFLVKYLYEKYSIGKMLVSDVTWETDGVSLKKGVVISYRDRSIPRKSFIHNVIDVAKDTHLQFQTEVEAHGASDGREIQASPYPIDWCFIGPPVANIHSQNETVAKSDLKGMITFYKALMDQL